MEGLKYVDQYGMVESDELRSAIKEIDSILIPLFENCSCVEASCIARLVQSSVSYQAAHVAMLKKISDVNNNEKS